MNDWQSVFKDEQAYRVEIVKAVLQDNGLRPVVVNKKIAPYDIGNLELLVAPDEVLKAIRIINQDINFE